MMNQKFFFFFLGGEDIGFTLISIVTESYRITLLESKEKQYDAPEIHRLGEGKHKKIIKKEKKITSN